MLSHSLSTNISVWTTLQQDREIKAAETPNTREAMCWMPKEWYWLGQLYCTPVPPHCITYGLLYIYFLSHNALHSLSAIHSLYSALIGLCHFLGFPPSHYSSCRAMCFTFCVCPLISLISIIFVHERSKNIEVSPEILQRVGSYSKEQEVHTTKKLYTTHRFHSVSQPNLNSTHS